MFTKLRTYGFCLVRRPVLSRNVLEDFHTLISDHPSEFESGLRRIFSDPLLLEALALASGPVYELTKELIENKPVSGKEKLLDSLYKFLIRAASRPTPFGLFAGYLILKESAETKISFCKLNPLKRHSQMDISAMEAVKLKVLENKDVNSELLFYTNSSLYRVADCYRYLKRAIDNNQTTFILTQAGYDPILEMLLAHSKNGLKKTQLQNLLEVEGYSAGESSEYIESLIEAQILVSSIEISVITDKDYLSSLLQALSASKKPATITVEIENMHRQLDGGASASEINAFLEVIAGKQHPLHATLQTTLEFKTDSAGISRRLLSDLGSQLGRIGFLSQSVNNDQLDDFTSRFTARYGQQSVPLLTALDYDYGIGYGTLSAHTNPVSPLLDGIETKNEDVNEDPLTNKLAQTIYQRAFSAIESPVELDEGLLERHRKTSTQTLPQSFYVLGSFHAVSEKALDEGDYLFELKGLSGPGAGNLMTRFCCSDKELARRVKIIAGTEHDMNDKTIYAEIAHQPAGKGGNVVQRPALTRYQITYLAARSQQRKYNISPADLWLSCPDGKNLVLSCPQLERQVIPVLSSAHNYIDSLPVYRFLCDLANQNGASLTWDWAQLRDAAFLPRVQYQKIILSKASWLITDVKENQTSQSQSAWWEKTKHKLSLPRYFTVGDSDQTLLIDGENEYSLRLLNKILKKQGKLRITESLEATGKGVLSEGEAYFCNEIVIPYQNTERQQIQQFIRKVDKRKPTKITRDFTVGSQWLYVKIYCAEKLTDELLTGILFPLIAALENQKVIQKWFFVRYQDPQPHIRLRFYSETEGFWVIVLEKLHRTIQPHLKSGRVRAIQTDTYQRERERYPPEIYPSIESVFHCESKSVANLLTQTVHDTSLRWQAALMGTAMLLDCTGFDLNDRLALIKSAHVQFAAELDKGAAIQRQMDQNYRSHKVQIIQVLRSITEITDLHILTDVFKSRDSLICQLLNNGAVSDKRTKNQLVTDLIHMFLNRCFLCDQRHHEFAVYHYIKKYYSSELKISQRTKIFL